MKITSINQMKAFENAIERCTSSVWVIPALGGRQYDLKDEMERYGGLAKMLEDDMEIFTSNYHDSAVMERFYLDNCA